jgi:hypothetical protein
MTTYKDTDLREALRRKYADTPQMPADLSERLMKRMETTREKPRRRYWPYITAAIAATASILLLIVLNFGQGQTGQKPVMAEKPTAPADSVRQMRHIALTSACSVCNDTVAAQTTPAKPNTSHTKATGTERSKADSASAAEELAKCIARLEAEMANIDDSVSAAHLEKLIAADARLQQMVYRIIGKQTEQAFNEMEKDSTANYINF